MTTSSHAKTRKDPLAGRSMSSSCCSISATSSVTAESCRCRGQRWLGAPPAGEMGHDLARNSLHLVQRVGVWQQAEVEVADHFLDARRLHLLELMDDLVDG